MQSKDRQNPGIPDNADKQQQTSPAAADARPAPQGGPRAHTQPGNLNKGASPTNRAPYNSKGTYFQFLRWGVDSLYLSYPGILSPESNSLLKSLKTQAQSPLPDQKAQAQLAVENHHFEVKDKGASLFPYILEDNCFRIQLARSKGKLPMAYAKVSSDYLAHVGVEPTEEDLRSTLAHLGELAGSPNVSRIDLFVDFTTNIDPESWDRHAWVTRAESINAYAVDGRFTGWSIGLGGIMSARLYNKGLEIAQKGHKLYLPGLWEQSGWDGQADVWRLEFQFKREVLTQKGLSSLPSVLMHLNGLWSYAMDDWLRLTIPNPEDKTRSRWPIHPLWVLLSAVDWESKGGPLPGRFCPTRAPSDEMLFSRGLSPLVAFMAREGIQDLYQGQEAFFTALYAHHEQRSLLEGVPFEQYIREKVALKAREYNLGVGEYFSFCQGPNSDKALKDEAEAYRKASDGE